MTRFKTSASGVNRHYYLKIAGHTLHIAHGRKGVKFLLIELDAPNPSRVFLNMTERA